MTQSSTYSHHSRGWSFTHLCTLYGYSPDGTLAQAYSHYAVDSVQVNSTACAQGIRENWESAWLIIRLSRATTCFSSLVFLFYVIMRLFDLHTTLLFQNPVDLYWIPHISFNNFISSVLSIAFIYLWALGHSISFLTLSSLIQMVTHASCEKKKM